MGKGGGVLVYVRDTIKCSQLNQPSEVSIEHVSVRISLSAEMSFVLVCLYRPPSAKSDFYVQLKALLKHHADHAETIIIGDYNINWDVKKDRKNLKQTMDDFNLSQLIEQPTRLTNNSKTRIDLLFSNRPERIVTTYNLLTGLSDHNIIMFSRKLTKSRFLNSFSKPVNSAPLNDFIPKNQQQHLATALHEYNWDKILECGDTENSCDLFNKSVKEVIAPFTSRGRKKRRQEHSLLWVTEECRALMSTRDTLLKQSLKSGLRTDRHKFTSYRNKVTQALRKAKANYFLEIIENAHGNGKVIWQNINKLLGRQCKQDKELELTIKDTLVRDPITLATSLNHFFLESVNEIAQLFSTPECIDSPVNPTQPVFEITEIADAEIAKIISNLSNSKAKDVFGLNTNFIKEHKDSLVRPITHLVNLSLRHAVVPSVWKVAAVTPIFKSGKKSDMSNYRPISILPIISKIAEKWVAQLLVEHLNKDHPLLHPMQFGFRAFHSTETAMCVLVEKIKGLLDRSACVGAVFLDLKRAFDTVDHQVLLSRLTHFNFSAHAIEWFKSYLSNRRQFVTVDGVKSPCLDCPVGVPQGSVLGPLLFSLFINTLPNSCQNIHTQMYADDAVIFTPAKNIQEASRILTSAASDVQDWLTKSCLLLNTKKTVCMMFSKRKQTITHSNVFFNGVELELVTDFKYLGVILDPTLTFKNQVKKVVNSVKFNLLNFKHIRNSMSVNAARTFLHAMIFSHFEYCLTSWSLTCASTLKPLEALYKRALKVFDRKPQFHHYCNILEKHKFLSFSNFISFKNACTIYKVFNGLAPPPLNDHIKQRPVCGPMTITTRASDRGDCLIPFRRTTFGQTVLSVKGSKFWNTIPTTIREYPTLSTFKKHLKEWLKSTQICTHV